MQRLTSVDKKMLDWPLEVLVTIFSLQAPKATVKQQIRTAVIAIVSSESASVVRPAY
jgi:hypothetical protein